MVSFFQFFCSKNAYVASTHLVARCTRRSTNSWISNFSRYTFKNGGLWFFKIFCANVPFSFRVFYSIDLHSKYNCNYLHFISCFDARRYEEINCIFISCSYGICNIRNIHFYKTRHRRQYLSNDKSWINFSSFIFMCWSCLRQIALKNDKHLRRNS